ncbi:MAG: sialidase family protein [Gemmatimonadaceae bacterium]
MIFPALLVAAILLGACQRADSPVSRVRPVLDSLPSPTAPGSAEPNLFAASDGRVYLTWLEPTADSGHALRFAVLESPADSHPRWSTPRTIAAGRDFFVNWADFPSLIALPGGRLAAHWLQRSDTGKYSYDVRIAQSGDGGASWSTPVTPHRDGVPAEHGFVSLFATEGDSLGAAWLDGRKFAPSEGGTKEMMLLSTTISGDGSLGAERRLDERICDCCQTSVAASARGPVAAFRDRSPDEIRDISVVRHVNGAWTTPVPVHADGWRIDFCPVNGPSVSARGEQVAVAWFTGSRDTARVQVAFSGDGGATFGHAFRVDGGTPEGRVDVELDERGAALVSWVERIGGEGAEVRIRRVDPNGEMGEPLTVAASSAARASGFPRMAATGEGRDVILAWTVPGTPSAVRVARTRLGPVE